jgi:hypothetical protein
MVPEAHADASRPEVEVIATSHRHDNAVAGALFGSVGFVPWELEGLALKPAEVYLRLPRRPPGGSR